MSGGAADASELVVAVTRLAELSRRRVLLQPPDGAAKERARQLRDHVASYLLPRARSLEAPLLVLILGPTGSGKSTLMNTIAGRAVSRTGVLRPTTRDAVLLATPPDAHVLLEDGPLAGIPHDRLLIASEGSRAGVAVIDAPDVDSVEHANRALADALVEAADLCLFVTTGTRYADRVPWDVLRRVKERGLPMIVVLNRVAGSEQEIASVRLDVERLLLQAGLSGESASERAEIITVREGERSADEEALARGPVAPVLDRIDRLAGDAGARRALAARALAGALGGVDDLVQQVADDLEHEALDVDAIKRAVEAAYSAEWRALVGELRGGRFLREQVLRQWQTFVGADQVTRFFASGIGKVRATIGSLFSGAPPAPIAIVEEQTRSDLVALATARASDAARRTAAKLAESPRLAARLADDPSLWAPDAGFADRLEARLRSWVSAIAGDVATTGSSKATLARGASFGVNAVGVSVMLGVFAHTGGLTGAEVGVAAATAFLNQKLLQALFGEAATVEMIERARTRLEVELQAAFAEDRARYEHLAPPSEALRTLADDLRASLNALPAAA